MRAKFFNVFKASAAVCAVLGTSTWGAQAADLGLKVSPGSVIGS